MVSREDDTGILKKIEDAIIAVFSRNPWMVDYTVLNALEAAVKHYKMEQYDAREIITELSQSEEEVYKGIRAVCDMQTKRKESPELDITENSGRIVDLLKTLLASIEKADRESDPQSYLKIISKT